MGANISPQPGMIICCALRDVPMNSKLLEFFTYHPNLPLNALRKLIANDKNQEIFSVEKQQKIFFSNVLEMKPQILFQNWMRIFWGIADFCRSKNKDFRKFACTRERRILIFWLYPWWPKYAPHETYQGLKWELVNSTVPWRSVVATWWHQGGAKISHPQRVKTSVQLGLIARL